MGGPGESLRAFLTWDNLLLRGRGRGLTGGDAAVFPPHGTVGGIAPRGNLSSSVTAVVSIQIPEKEGIRTRACQEA